IAIEEYYDEITNISGEPWLNYSCQHIEVSTHFMKNILEPGICGCGILGIILTMFVLSRKTMCTSTNCYLTGLAVADLLFLLILSSQIFVNRTEDCNFHLGSKAALFQQYSIIFMDIFQYLTVGITVMLAVERYIAICHPMRAMTICTVKRARIIIIVLTVVAFILRSPKFAEMDIIYVTAESEEEETMIVTNVYVYDEAIYTYIVTGVLLTFVPLLALLVLNVRLIMEIRKSSRYLQYHLGIDWHVRSVVSREELKMTMMLVSVIVAFFVCYTPYMIYTFFMAVKKFDTSEDPSLTKTDFWKHFKYTCNVLLALKSSCNFVLYCWFSEKFWITFKRIFCLSVCPPKQSVIQNSECRTHSQNYINRLSSYATKKTSC
ncbi:unnamed protein product, partial [Candidula unifasciata]